jgi:hypothetical protein
MNQKEALAAMYYMSGGVKIKGERILELVEPFGADADDLGIAPDNEAAIYHRERLLKGMHLSTLVKKLVKMQTPATVSQSQSMGRSKGRREDFNLNFPKLARSCGYAYYVEKLCCGENELNKVEADYCENCDTYPEKEVHFTLKDEDV